MRCEVLLDEGMSGRGKKMLQAMIDAAPAAGVEVIASRSWRKAAPVLMSYGLGHSIRRGWTRAHVERGGRLIGWDLGYWQRDEPLRFGMRLTLDADHPQKWIQPEPPERFDGTGIELREDFNPSGPVVLCGLGPKQRRWKGYRGQAWELAALAKIRKQYPDRPVVYRPKKLEPLLKGCKPAFGTIEDSLRGASLLVCAHSNVAVDACIAGVPAICEDGAAFALYRDNPAPTRAQRLEFLRSLAWWNWNPTEALQAWAFIRAKLCA